MHRKLGALLVAFTLLFFTWSGPAEAQSASSPLAETRWTGSWSIEGGPTHPIVAYFRSDGVLVYTDNSVGGTQYDNGRWRQRELLVTFEMNNYFVLFAGLEQNADYVSGTWYNMRGERGVWTLTRQR